MEYAIVDIEDFGELSLDDVVVEDDIVDIEDFGELSLDDVIVDDAEIVNYMRTYY